MIPRKALPKRLRFHEQGIAIRLVMHTPVDEFGSEPHLRLAAVLAGGGRTMEVYTTMPALQVYTGNWVEKNVGKSGREYDIQTAVCLEAQNCPDAINHANFPSPVLRPGDIYFEQTEYRFV